MLRKVKYIVVGTRAAGGVISRRMVIAIGKGVVKANKPNLLKEFGGNLDLTEGWSRGVLKSLDWTKRKGTTEKVDPSDQLLMEEKLMLQRNISTAILEHDIPEDLALNLDQTPLSYVLSNFILVNYSGRCDVNIYSHLHIINYCQPIGSFIT